MDSDDSENGNEPQPSTSRTYTTRRARRTVMTPSPLRGTDSESEEEEQPNTMQQTVPTSAANKGQFKVPDTKIDSLSKKRIFTAEEGADSMDSRSKRKKAEVQYAAESSDSESGENHQKPNSKRSKRVSPVDSPRKTSRKRQKVTNLTPMSQTRSSSLACPSSSIASIGSQLIFSQTKVESHAGIIKSLHLTNFMCHSNFEHDFHHNLNFITGQNGSGKSALLSGILIALGGKATVTSRTTSLKALIQKGKNTGRVAVTLLNKNGLRRYGQELTIERWVSVGGNGGYRIKSSGGDDPDCCFNWRPLKKPELDRILLGLNIQIDNPVAVLNQEVARSFLRSKDPKVKFTLFYDGTILSKLETVIKETKDEVQETDRILDHHKQVIKSVKKEIVVLQQKYEKIAELDEVKKKLSKVHQEYLWALVSEQEEEVQKINAEIVRTTKEVDILTERIEKSKVDLANVNEDQLRKEQGEVKKRLDETQRLVNKNRTELNEIKRTFGHLKARLRTIVSTIDTKEKQIRKLSDQLETVKAAQAAREKTETNQDAEKLNELETEKKQLESSITSLKSDSDNFQQAADQERINLNKVENEARSLKSQIEHKRRFISNLTSRTASKYAVFGPKMEQLMAKVHANHHRFKSPPKGPLGACFRVRDSQYAAILEGVLFNHLDAFVVGDPKDLLLLREIIDSVYNSRGASQQRQTIAPGFRQPSIHCMRYAQRMYDISRNHSSIPDAPSIVDLIEVEDGDFHVLNALIDIAEIEKQIVFKNNQTAAVTLKNEETVPKSLKCAYTLQWYKFTPVPNYAARVMKIRSRAEFLKSGRSKEAEIEAVNAEIRNLEQELKRLEPQKTAIRSKERVLKESYDGKVREINEVRRRLGEINIAHKRHIARVKEKEKNSDFSSFYEELDELREDCNKHIKERDAVNKALEPIQPKLEELENERKVLDEESQKLANKLNGFEEVMDKLSTRRLQIETAIKKIKKQVDILEDKKSKHSRELQGHEVQLKEKRESAKKECPKRIPTKRSAADAKKEHEGLRVRITETEARLGDREEVEANLTEARQKYRSLMKELNPLFKMFRMIEQTNLDQEKSFNTMKVHMGRTLTYFFSSMAKHRGYEGRLMVDFEARELYYFVCPDGDSASKTLKAIDAQQQKRAGPQNPQELKQRKLLKKALIEYSLGLSGGERSFATICFIMALWQVMECPFYMLDEFDVFMDAFNRKTSQTALMAHAKRFCQNQFVLFTPLDLGELPSPEDACVLRLMPPVRTGGGGGSGAGSSGANGNVVDNSPPQGGSSSNQGASKSGNQRRGNDSPSESTENIDPFGDGVSIKSKEGKRVRGTQRRVVVMREH